MKRSDLWPRKSQVDPARAGLLDRLTDLEPNVPEEPRPLRTYTRDELIDAIIRELDRVFNTRCIVPKKELKQRERTVLEYGVSDYTGMNPRALEDHQTLARSIREAILRYEPRLQQVKVSVDPDPPNERTLVVHVEALLQFEGIREPVSFPIIVRNESGQVTLNAQ